MNVLVVEDDDSVLRFVVQALAEAGYAVRSASDGPSALDLATLGEFDLILLDVMLPGMDGFEVCHRLRRAGIATPVLVITARDALEDKVAGLDNGADDYIVKPFQMAELLARMRALLRRGVATTAVLQVADLTLDTASRRASRGGRPIRLSATEYSLLEYLMRNTGRVLTRGMILDHVWDHAFEGSDNVVEVYVSYLRGKIDRPAGVPLIHTVRGMGYRMDAPDAG